MLSKFSITTAGLIGNTFILIPDASYSALANAAGAAYGMALAGSSFEGVRTDKPTVGMTNLGVLTDGAMHAKKLLRERGFEVIVFHAVGSGGRAMEQLMREGVIDAVFDYALGELSDEGFICLPVLYIKLYSLPS